jgi:DNA-binding NtrC family response regulator
MSSENPAPKPTVLIVEDEMILRMRAVDMVEDAGFSPIEAVNADDALALLESRSDIELLFTDIQMPGTMNGLKLAHAVHERWPAIKIILVSGKLTPTENDRPAESRFFGKPIEARQMIAELQAMIGHGSLKIIPTDMAGDQRRRGGNAPCSKKPDGGKRQPSRPAGAGRNRCQSHSGSSRYRRRRARDRR